MAGVAGRVGQIGTFAVRSGVLVAGDPCFALAARKRMRTWKNVKTGTWRAFVHWSAIPGPIARLTALHEKQPDKQNDRRWIRFDDGVPIESGMLVVADREALPDGQEEFDEWYDDLSDTPWQELGQHDRPGHPNLALCDTGGDGCFPIARFRDTEGLVVGLRVTFGE